MRYKRQKKQKGFYTLESVVAIIIFSIGILGVVQLQTSSISNVTDGIYRTTASSLGENILSTILLDRKNLAGYVDGTSEEYLKWTQEVEKNLPGVLENPPIIEVTEKTYGKSVKVVIQWKHPSSNVVSNYETNITLY